MTAAPMRILLIDDQADQHLLISNLLLQIPEFSFDLISATSYDQGLQSLLSQSPDLCLIDYYLGLGRRTGLDLLRAAAAQQVQTPMIILTSDNDRSIDLAAMNAGAADFLSKTNLTALLLERSLRYCLAHATTLRELRKSEERYAVAQQQLQQRERLLEHFVQQLLVAQEEERRQIAYDLHDSVAQTTTSLYMQLQAFAHQYQSRSSSGRCLLKQMLDTSQRVVKEIRQVVAGLRPTLLDDLGFVAALEYELGELRRVGWELSYEKSWAGQRLHPGVESALFRIAQEALRNVVKHAGKTAIAVTLEGDDQRVRMTIRDWGGGFAADSPPSSTPAPGERIGLHSMSERARLLGGSLEVTSQPGGGTQVRAEIPLLPQAQQAPQGSDAWVYQQLSRTLHPPWLTDGLTQLYTYRSFLELGERELQRARRFGTSLCLLRLELDAPAAGAMVETAYVEESLFLRIAETCRAMLRSVDLIGHYGRTGLLVLLVGTARPGGSLVAERLRGKLATQPIETVEGRLFPQVRIGIAEWSEAVADLESLIEAAFSAPAG